MSGKPRARPTPLHKPLAAPPGAGARGWLWAVAALLLVSGIAAFWWWTGWQGEERSTRVALGDEVAVTTPASDVGGLERPDTVTVGGETMQTLSPLEPLEPLEPPRANGADGMQTAVLEQPDFQPRIEAPKRAHPGIPIRELVEPSDFGPLPRIGESGLRPLDAYAAEAPGATAARIAVVVGGLGLSQTGTKEAIERLPSTVTLAFSPYGNSLSRWMTLARREGHEVVLQLPMEPLGYPSINPGPRTLVRSADPKTNIDNLRWALGRMTNYPIVMNYLGAGIVTKGAPMEAILEEIHSRGLAWFDDGTVAASAVPALAKQKRIPNARGTLTIDASRDDARIVASLTLLEQTAKRRGFAIGSATAFPTSVALIAEWAEKAQSQGVKIVPLSALIKDYSR